MARGILGLLHVTKEKLDHSYISFDRSAEGVTVHCGQGTGVHDMLEELVLCAPKKTFSPKIATWGLWGKRRVGVSGCGEAGGVPVSATLDGSPNLSSQNIQ